MKLDALPRMEGINFLVMIILILMVTNEPALPSPLKCLWSHGGANRAFVTAAPLGAGGSGSISRPILYCMNNYNDNFPGNGFLTTVGGA